jgi:uncharacterized protein YggE
MTKKMLFIFVTILASIALSACVAPASSANAAVTPISQMSVNGTGLVYVVPDIAYIYMGVHTQASSVAQALQDNTQAAQTLKNALVAQGVEEKDIQTSNFNVYPQPQYDTSGKPTGTLYAVDNTVFVTVRKLDTLGTLLDVVTKNGANNINGVSFDIQDKNAALEQARKLAIQDAQKQAEQVAADAGVKLGRIINISLYNANAPVTLEGKGGGGGSSMMAAQVPVSSGQLSITADVNLIYEINQ